MACSYGTSCFVLLGLSCISSVLGISHLNVCISHRFVVFCVWPCAETVPVSRCWTWWFCRIRPSRGCPVSVSPDLCRCPFPSPHWKTFKNEIILDGVIISRFEISSVFCNLKCFFMSLFVVVDWPVCSSHRTAIWSPTWNYQPRSFFLIVFAVSSYAPSAFCRSILLFLPRWFFCAAFVCACVLAKIGGDTA